MSKDLILIIKYVINVVYFYSLMHAIVFVL